MGNEIGVEVSGHSRQKWKLKDEVVGSWRLLVVGCWLFEMRNLNEGIGRSGGWRLEVGGWKLLVVGCWLVLYGGTSTSLSVTGDEVMVYWSMSWVSRVRLTLRLRSV